MSNRLQGVVFPHFSFSQTTEIRCKYPACWQYVSTMEFYRLGGILSEYPVEFLEIALHLFFVACLSNNRPFFYNAARYEPRTWGRKCNRHVSRR